MKSVIIPIEEESQVGYARRTAVCMSEELGFDEAHAARVALVATEVASNIIRHARFGHVFLRTLEAKDSTGLEIMAIDQGPGFTEAGSAFTDGFSTCGGPGMGLGAIVRLSSISDFYSMPGRGLGVLSQLWFSEAPREKFTVGGIAIPYPEEKVCGDSWFAEEIPTGMTLFLADGLGHGVLAAEASLAGVDIVRETKTFPPSEILRQVQKGTSHTRGSVGFLAQVDIEKGQVVSAGLGNIDARMVSASGEQKHLVSQQGTLGTRVEIGRRIREFSTDWSAGDTLCMTSDGIRARWHAEDLPGLFSHHPSLICGILWREFARGTDDASILICKEAWN